VDDPYELVYTEAVRALEARRDALESLRSRAGVILSGAAIASSLFGSRTVGAGLSAFGWIAVLAFGGLTVALLAVLWPRAEWQDATLPSRLLGIDIEVRNPLSGGLIKRHLALQMEAVYHENTKLYEELARWFRAAATLLAVEASAWALDLAIRA
jgi:hypothetical protein